MMKRCPSCDQVLPEDAFGRNKTLPDGLSCYCRSCSRARSNRWYRESRQRLGKEVRDHSWVPEGFRWCPACRQAVAHEDYTKNSRTATGFGSMCRSCKASADSAAYFYRKYKLTRNHVAAMRAAQDDRCAICSEAGPQHLDHDHQIGVTRQLLCQRCNQGLGLFRDDPAALRAAADYVERHRRRQAGASTSPSGTRPGRSRAAHSPGYARWLKMQADPWNRLRAAGPGA
jgi:hypothetical protein